jgi:tetratricopeptide (TPR) repeat protein
VLLAVSRPDQAGFIDPRSDPAAVLDALDLAAAGRYTSEFLRPATFEGLVRRLRDPDRPQVDVLHFDGHGYFDREGLIDAHVRQLNAQETHPDTHDVLRAAGEAGTGVGYLLFETARHGCHFVSAGALGQQLNEQRVPLVVLSACQSAALALRDQTDQPGGSGGAGGQFTPKLWFHEHVRERRHEARDAADAPVRQDSPDPAAEAEAAPELAEQAARNEPMGSVAVRLTAAGIPSVLAMTHSVLVATTRRLFGRFYHQLADGHGIGAALDEARNHLMRHPDKHEILRRDAETGEIVAQRLKLFDWFLPALYQNQRDLPLLERRGQRPAGRFEAAEPPAGAGDPRRRFFGRTVELWQIERWFVDGARRVAVTGFGGQGKTRLAEEAAGWLQRTGLFSHAVWVDYRAWQGGDAVSAAIAAARTVLPADIVDAGQLPDALRAHPALLVLDNLEAVPEDELARLLAAATEWSQCGASRVLVTTRLPQLPHVAWSPADWRFRCLPLEGLGSARRPSDALDWFTHLYSLPPQPTVRRRPWRRELVQLFDQVRFHPLSIRVLAEQLKTRPIEEVAERLGELVAAATRSLAGESRGTTEKESSLTLRVTMGEDTPPGLIASLELSLERLDPRSRALLPHLGIFAGGAMEDMILKVTVLGGDDPKQLLSGADESTWPALRRALEAAALVEVEAVPGVPQPFVRFHPTLAPLLWHELAGETGVSPGEPPAACTRDVQGLLVRYRRQYYELSRRLYFQDDKDPDAARGVARREMPNLLRSVRAALDAGDDDAVDFVGKVNYFLQFFGQTREAESLTARARQAAQPGERAWYLAQSSHGEQLYEQGRIREAAAVFAEILQTQGGCDDAVAQAARVFGFPPPVVYAASVPNATPAAPTDAAPSPGAAQPSYERCQTLARLARCYRVAKQPGLAAELQRRALADLDRLEPTPGVLRQKGVGYTDLADALTDAGDYDGARDAYQDGLKIAREVKDQRGEGVVLGQLGTLAMLQGDLSEAAARWSEALELFQRIGEPKAVATAWHQLGMVYQEARQWEQAERHYKESARIKEQQGDLHGAAESYNQLAIVNQLAGKPEVAEQWFGKAIGTDRQLGNAPALARDLNNLADLLRTQPGRLPDARRAAEEALEIDETLDPGAAEIWKDYQILAEIAAAEGDAASARNLRRQARTAKWNWAGTRYELRRFAPLIALPLAALAEEDPRGPLHQMLAEQQRQMRAAGAEWTQFADALDRLLADPQISEDDLCGELPFGSATILMAIQAGLRDPASLADLLPPQPAETP